MDDRERRRDQRIAQPFEPAPGVAICNAFGSLQAHVVELSVSADQTITLQRIVAAIDPGIVLDPEITRNAIEGDTAWGL